MCKIVRLNHSLKGHLRSPSGSEHTEKMNIFPLRI